MTDMIVLELYLVSNYWSANGFRLACYSEVSGVLNPSYWEDSGGTTLRLLDSQSKSPQAGLLHWLTSGENKREHLVL